ncbi:MAG: hypothetical protein IJZ76_00500, partial [Lachnospiraceae bacterium]|nr:hypothetical protein [Lachnospiraceae bacterium]
MGLGLFVLLSAILTQNQKLATLIPVSFLSHMKGQIYMTNISNPITASSQKQSYKKKTLQELN